MTELRIQNAELRTKIDIYNADINQKQLLLTQREHQYKETINSLKQSLTTRDTDDSRKLLDTLVYQATRFLNAMRQLQKVVHKKEVNVVFEKLEFEKSKKDLETTLKNI